MACLIMRFGPDGDTSFWVTRGSSGRWVSDASDASTFEYVGSTLIEMQRIAQHGTAAGDSVALVEDYGLMSERTKHVIEVQ